MQQAKSRLTVRIQKLKTEISEQEKMKTLYDMLVPGYSDIHEHEIVKLERRLDTLEGVRKKVRRIRFKSVVKEKQLG
jgi:hypothetical protein